MIDRLLVSCALALTLAAPVAARPAAPALRLLEEDLRLDLGEDRHDEERAAPTLAQRRGDKPPANTRRPSDRSNRRSESRRQPAKKAAPRGPVTVPIDVGFGPQLMVPNPPLFFDQPAFTALTLSIAAVISKDLIEKNKNQVPAEYRNLVSNVSEVRYRPLWLLLVPDVIYLSPHFLIPNVTTTGMYGALWRPIGIGIDLMNEPVRFNVHADLAAAYIFMHSELRGMTHFLRPGLSLSATLEVPLGETFLISTGWASDFFVPQPLGQPPWTIFPLEDSLWHLGGPFVKLHVRIPYEVSL
jgi:hypothetical protein